MGAGTNLDCGAPPPKQWLGVPLGFKSSSWAGLWYSQFRWYLLHQYSGNTDASPEGLPRPPSLTSSTEWGPTSNPDPLRTRVPAGGCKPIPIHAVLRCKGLDTGRLWDIRDAST